jgi:hypothetical protein
MSKDMIKVKLLLLFFAIATTATAQTNEEAKTVFGNGKPDIGYFVSPSVQFGNIAGSTAVIPGIGAGILFNHKFYVGLNYKFIATENTPGGESDNRLYLDQRWGGLRFEYSFQNDKVVHFSFPLELGIGETELDLKDSYENEGVVPSGDAWFAFVEPGAAIEINLMKYMKLNFTVGYRLISDVSFRNLTEKDLMGFTWSAGLKMGIF